jgi:hypothetical protein
VNSLHEAIRDGDIVGNYDLNSDGTLDFSDVEYWVHEVAKTYFGDSNLDGEFNSADLIGLFQIGHYEDAIDGNSRWETGDGNGDGNFSSGDLVLAFQDGGYERGPRGSVATVPEPSPLISCVAAAIGLLTV